MDFVIFETLNGGDLSVQDKDVALTASFWPIIYTALFGGNPGFSTVDGSDDDEQRHDWWGNIFLDDPNERINSATEKSLTTTALNSAGRVAIEQAVKNDLSALSALGGVEVAVVIEAQDRIIIEIGITETTTKVEQRYRILWDGTRSGEITDLGVDKKASAASNSWILVNGIWEDLGTWFDSEYWKDNI